MKKYYIGKETLKVLESTNVELKYYILETEHEDGDAKFIEYGIEIEKKDATRIEKSQISNITTNHTRIDFIVKTLMKNSVTPIHLHDVIVDML